MPSYDSGSYPPGHPVYGSAVIGALRTDAAQTLTTAQQDQGQTNLGVLRSKAKNGYFWDFGRGQLPPGFACVRSTIGYDLDATTQFAINAARITSKGLLVEPAATNLIRYSNDQSNAVWTKFGGTTTLAKNVGPDNAMSLAQVASSGGSQHGFYGTGDPLVNGTPVVVSAFVRAGTARYLSMRAESSSTPGGSPWITFDTLTGAIAANPAVISSGYSDLGGGLYRIWLKYDPSTIGAGNFVFSLSDVATAPDTATSLGNSYNGVLTGYFGMIQAEQTKMTSYFPTVAATATRAADAISWTIAADRASQIFTFDDYSTQTVSVTAGTYNAPPNLNRPIIRSIEWV